MKATRAAVLSLLIVLLLGCGADKEKAAHIDLCKRHAARELRSPGTAVYGSIGDIALNPARASLFDEDGYAGGSGRHIWFAYVDSQNALGATVRAYLVCLQDQQDDLLFLMTEDINQIRAFID